MHVCQARRLTQVSSPAGEAGSVRRRLRMSPCALFSCSRYLANSGATFEDANRKLAYTARPPNEDLSRSETRYSYYA